MKVKSVESEWVAQCLEDLGHDVIVADPGYAPMYPNRRRIKTDRRDAEALAVECRQGTYRCAHRVSSARRTDRGRGARPAARGCALRDVARWHAL